MDSEQKMDAFLLVEGENDWHVISALCQKHNVPQTFKISPPKASGMNAGGIEQLLKNFRLRLRGSAGDTKAIGIVLDADNSPDKRWSQVATEIERLNERLNIGYDIPKGPVSDGVIIAAPNKYNPRIGIWLMPNNNTFGAIEDFVTFLIPSEDGLPDYANNVLNKIEDANLNRYGKKRNKAFIHTWLAWQHEPGLPMGRAITANALSADSPIALIFVDWMNRLFNA